MPAVCSEYSSRPFIGVFLGAFVFSAISITKVQCNIVFTLVVMKSRETRAVIYTCRYSIGHFNVFAQNIHKYLLHLHGKPLTVRS